MEPEGIAGRMLALPVESVEKMRRDIGSDLRRSTPIKLEWLLAVVYLFGPRRDVWFMFILCSAMILLRRCDLLPFLGLP